jgi:hypothetical protein
MDQIDRYLEFLKWCLNPTDQASISDIIEQMDWHNLKLFAKRQKIVGVYWYAMQQHLKLKDDVVLDWMSYSLKVPSTNKKVYEQCVEITEFFKKEGFRTCILKGQGNALLYPDAYTRNPGDIDIWVEGGRDKVVDFICRVSHPKEVVYHDIDFPYSKEILVEAHFIPAYLENPFLNKKLQKYISTVADEQFRNVVEAPDGIGKFSMPTLGFNIIYQLLHLDKHLRTEGIGIRQLIDYYYLLKNWAASPTSQEKQEEIHSLLKEFKLLKFTSAVMYVLHDVLGLEQQYLLVPPNEKEGKFLLDEIIQSGDMGKRDMRLNKMRKANGIKKFLQLEQFKFRLLSHYPTNVIWMPFHDLYVHFFYIKKYQKKYNLPGMEKKAITT